MIDIFPENSDGEDRSEPKTKVARNRKMSFYVTHRFNNNNREIVMDLLKHEMPLLDGSLQALDEYRGKVVLIVNTASQCGFTPQYKGLETLYEKYQDSGLVILGFPCNQFGKQEPGSSDEIGQFCEKNYGVTFPIFEKIDVNGDSTAPLYQDLKAAAPGVMGTKKIKWNFTKFVINRNGDVVGRYAPTTKPEDLEEVIQTELGLTS